MCVFQCVGVRVCVILRAFVSAIIFNFACVDVRVFACARFCVCACVCEFVCVCDCVCV